MGPNEIVVILVGHGNKCCNSSGFSSNASASVWVYSVPLLPRRPPSATWSAASFGSYIPWSAPQAYCTLYRKAPRRLRRSTLAPASGIHRTFAAKASTQRNIESCIVWFVHTMVCHRPKIAHCAYRRLRRSTLAPAPGLHRTHQKYNEPTRNIIIIFRTHQSYNGPTIITTFFSGPTKITTNPPKLQIISKDPPKLQSSL